MGTDRPNILLLHTDQQRFDTIAALGASHMRTPNIDRLVQRGTAFNRAYSANPVCMPARHDLITGVSARHHGYWHNCWQPIRSYELATVPRLLTWAGYETYAVGKMHFAPAREHHGFSHMYLMEELPERREDDAYLQYLNEVGYGDVVNIHGVRPLFYHTPQRSRVPEEHHGSAWVAHKTIEVLRQPRNCPFFIFASWVGPHPPYAMPQEYLDLYRGAEIPSPCPLPEDSGRQAPPTPENAVGQQLQRIREAYYGAITLIDKHIGRILDTLEETGQLDDTLILFTSDHGEMLGDREAYQKHVPYEGSAHIPLIACGPGFNAGTSDTPATTWDVSATILAAANVRVPDDHPLVGEALTGVANPHERIVCYSHAEGQNRYVAAVGRGHKFVHWYNGGDEELYDLVADPWEQHNLIETDGSGVGGQLRDAAVAFEATHGIAGNVAEGTFVDREYKPVWPCLCTLHPDWAFRQHQEWMVDKQQWASLAAEEMRACLESEAAAICRNADWRVEAVREWERLGGDPAVYRELFGAVDAADPGRRKQPES